MSLKETLKAGIQAIGASPGVSWLTYHRGLRPLLNRVPGSHVVYGGWNRTHPFDRQYGTDTSGILQIDHDPAGDHMPVYGGSQPSPLRAALSTLPDLDRCTFVDLGCGKGRPLLVATEFPFRDIVGVEVSAELAEVARQNAEIMTARHPERTRLRVVVGDVTDFEFPTGDLVLFTYHSFGMELSRRVLRRIEAALSREPTARLFFVLYNPVNGALFDASPALSRRFARMLSYAPEERGFGPDLSDAVVVWQGGAVPAVPSPPTARIRITQPGARAELEE